MPARSVCLVTLPLSEAGPGRFGGQVPATDIYHTIPYPGRHQEQAPKQRCTFSPTTFSSVQFSSATQTDQFQHCSVSIQSSVIQFLIVMHLPSALVGLRWGFLLR